MVSAIRPARQETFADVWPELDYQPGRVGSTIEVVGGHSKLLGYRSITVTRGAICASTESSRLRSQLVRGERHHRAVGSAPRGRVPTPVGEAFLPVTRGFAGHGDDSIGGRMVAWLAVAPRHCCSATFEASTTRQISAVQSAPDTPRRRHSAAASATPRHAELIADHVAAVTASR